MQQLKTLAIMVNKSIIPESKSIMRIATECDTRYNAVRDVIKSLGIVLENKKVNTFQEDLIHESLYFTGKIKEVTYESKINSNETAD